MISAQIDELREWADQLSERENEFGVVVRALVAALRDAADTIWQLRDDLQQANAENARLRSELESVGTAAYLYGRGDFKDENARLRERIDELEELTDDERYIPQEWYAQLKAENAKLRELCADLYAIRDRSGTHHVTALQVRLDELGVGEDK